MFVLSDNHHYILPDYLFLCLVRDISSSRLSKLQKFRLCHHFHLTTTSTTTTTPLLYSALYYLILPRLCSLTISAPAVTPLYKSIAPVLSVSPPTTSPFCSCHPHYSHHIHTTTLSTLLPATVCIMSPRRSSRARTSQPSPSDLNHNSSTSNSNGKDRNTRSNRNGSPRASARSQSIDNDASKSDPRRNDDPAPHDEQDNEDDGDDEEEEEVTRCLCGQQEYPGLPPSRRETFGRSRMKNETGLISSDSASDDVGSLFIQCDSCKVWQHGGCVGILDERMCPDEYYCEECRKDLHKVRQEPNG